MARKFILEDLQTPSLRRKARQALMWEDHGVLRLFYDNSHEIIPGKLWRSYQPSPEKLEKWRARGIRTIINLRGETCAGHYVLEKEACKILGLTLINFRVYSREAPSKDVLRGIRYLFSGLEYPAMMHCKSGADRTGVMGTLYLFLVEGMPLDRAMEQLSFKYGHIRQGKTGVIDYAFEQYIHYAKTNNFALDDHDQFFHWVEHEYDPAAIKQEFLGTWWGRFLTERLLRRE